jgi:hypothetical protein
VLLPPGEVLPLAPLLAVRHAETLAVHAATPIALPAFQLTSPLAGLAELTRLTTLVLDTLDEDAAADPDAWAAMVEGLPRLTTLRIGLCTAWSASMYAALGRLRHLHTLGLAGVCTAPPLPGPATAGGAGAGSARVEADRCAVALGDALGQLAGLRELALTGFALGDGMTRLPCAPRHWPEQGRGPDGAGGPQRCSRRWRGTRALRWSTCARGAGARRAATASTPWAGPPPGQH